MSFLTENNAGRMNMQKLASGLFVLYIAPYCFQRVYWYADRASYWDKRFERKLLQKESFDFLLRQYAEQEDDLVTEYSDY